MKAQARSPSVGRIFSSGQSGNAGAQALAVTMRGLALREITVRESFRVSTKEMLVGVGRVNGLYVGFVANRQGLIDDPEHHGKKKPAHSGEVDEVHS